MSQTTRSIVLDREHSPIHNENMKTEKICINKKTLVISLIVIFLLGVVGVSYMVQRNISVKSRASGTETIVDKNCGLVLDTALASFFKDPAKNKTVIDFKDDYLDMNTSVEPGTTVGGCPKGQKYPFGLSTNNGRDPLFPQNCCLNEFSKSDHTSIDITLKDLGLKYNERDLLSKDDGYVPFSKIVEPTKVPVDRKASINTVGYQNEGKTCINYGAPEGSPDLITPQPCGDGVVTEEECLDASGKSYTNAYKDSRRHFKVECGAKNNSTGQNHCDFQCLDKSGNWKSGCSKTDMEICLPLPTEPPTANTFNSTNQTSNQSGAEDNLNCSQNLKQQDGSVLDTGYYKCYVATELLSGTSINRDGDISPAPTKINNRPVVYEANDGTMKLPRYVSTFYGRGKNEPCKKLVAGVSTNGVCASKK